MQLETVGEIVRILRARLDLEQVELARACGWRDASAVSRIETDRIRPTRRTLTKLADALANPDVTGTATEIKSYLFRAAGILPTADDVTAVGQHLPDIARWGQPAFIMDFGWYVWRANALAEKMIGLPKNYPGRNYIDLFFDPNGQIRRTLGDRWERAAALTLEDFKVTTEQQSDRRWFKKLMIRIGDVPDFQRLWNSTPSGARSQVHNRYQASVDGGNVSFVRLTLTAEPRLMLIHVVPEDASIARALVERGIMLA